MTTIVEPGAEPERLWTGAVWSEGPVWLPELGSVRWSDIPNNRILQYDAATGETHVYREPAEFTNGRTLDLDGHVVECSHGRRAVERDADGVVSTIVDRFEGHRLNSPNDVVVAADGSVWFTDPPYGILESGREGHPGEKEYGGCFVFRFEEATGRLTPVVTDMVHPNGLAFSPDESLLYVADTSFGDMEGGKSHIRVYDVVDGSCRNGRLFAEVSPPVPDGFRVDVEGRIWTSTGDSVLVLDPHGETVGRIPMPERVSNVCFGGADGRDLYITASTSLYRIRTTTTGAARPTP